MIAERLLNMEANEARLNITYKGQNGELPDPVNFTASQEEILRWVGEAVHTGSVPGITEDQGADFADFVVDRFEGNATLPDTDPAHYNRIFVRPKVPFGG